MPVAPDDTRTSRGRSRRLGLMALAVIGASGLAFAGVVGAASGLRYAHSIKKAPDSPPGGAATADLLPCPADTKIVGGGVAVTGEDADLEVGTSFPGGKAHWYASVNNTSGAGELMTTHAVCAESGSYRYPLAKEFTVAPGSTDFATRRCPPGTHVVGGGVNTAAGNVRIEVAATRPADGSDDDSQPENGWFAKASNEFDSTSVTMYVFAVCAENGRSLTYRKRSATVPAGGQRKLSVPCGTAGAPTGGGVDIAGLDSRLEVGDTYPRDGVDANGAPDDGWVGSANNETNRDRDFTVFVICKG